MQPPTAAFRSLCNIKDPAEKRCKDTAVSDRVKLNRAVCRVKVLLQREAEHSTNPSCGMLRQFSAAAFHPLCTASSFRLQIACCHLALHTFDVLLCSGLVWELAMRQECRGRCSTYTYAAALKTSVQSCLGMQLM